MKANGNVENINTWDRRIKTLMKHFGLEKESKEVITEVKATAKENESDDLLYERAWRKFRSILMVS